MAETFASLVWEARRQLHLFNRQWAEFTGVSLRTVERHGLTAGLNAEKTDKLIVRLYPVNPTLAKQLADNKGRSLETLGLVKRPAAVVAPPAQPVAGPEHADSVLVAAANVLNLSPEAVRPAVAAAFARAKAMGVSVGSLADQLARGAPTVVARVAASKSKARRPEPPGP